MKQIFVGSVIRTKLHTDIRNSVLPPHIAQAIIIALLIIIPWAFASRIFTAKNGDYSNVVLVTTLRSTGSAIYVGNQYLLTAAHVVQGMQVGDKCGIEFQDPNSSPVKSVSLEAELVTSGKFLPAEDIEEDYALLRILYVDASNLAKECPFGSAAKVKIQDNISVEGYPNGVYSSTVGTINNLNGGVTGSSKILVVSADAWGGNSGGALKSANGDMLGIVTMGGTVVGKTAGQTYVLKIDDIRNKLKGYGLPF